jgi:hypothetical protein
MVLGALAVSDAEPELPEEFGPVGVGGEVCDPPLLGVAMADAFKVNALNVTDDVTTPLSEVLWVMTSSEIKQFPLP